MANKGITIDVGAIDNASRKMRQISQNVSKSFGGINRTIAGTTRAVGNLSFALGDKLLRAGQIAGLALGSAGAIGLKSASNFEQTSIAIETMLGSAEKAKMLLGDLSEFAEKTPFEFPELADSTKLLIAFGESSDEVVGTLRRLGDVSAGLSVPIKQIAFTYGQVRVAGRLMGQDLMQFTNAGVPLIKELAKNLGIAESEVKDLVSEGKIGFKDVQKAFVTMTSEGGKFAGLMQRQSTSLGGLTSTAKDNLGLILRDIVGINEQGEITENSILTRSKSQLTTLISFLDSNREQLSSTGKQIISDFFSFLDSITKPIRTFIDNNKTQIFSILGSIKTIFSNVSNFILEFVEKNKSKLAGLMTTLSEMFKSLKDFFSDKEMQEDLQVILGFILDVSNFLGKWVIAPAFKASLEFVRWNLEQISKIVKGIPDFWNTARELTDKSSKFGAGLIQGGIDIGADLIDRGADLFRANGGNVNSGTPYVVGEKGPELFIPKQNGDIVPNNQMGGVNINFGGVTVRNEQDIQKIAKEVESTLVRQFQLNQRGINY